MISREPKPVGVRAAIRCAAFVAMVVPALMHDARADAGRIPVWRPLTITQPGHYYLTRDIAADASPAITIDADDVVLDLNGRTIRSTSFVIALILINDGSTRTHISNGHIVSAAGGGLLGIYSPSTSANDLQVENISFRSASIYATNAGLVTVEHCRFNGHGDNGCLEVSGGTASIRWNRFERCSSPVALHDVSGAHVSDNGIRGASTHGLRDILVQGGAGNYIERNTINEGSGLGIAVDNGNFVIGNVLSNSPTGGQMEGGIGAGDGNVIADNLLYNLWENDQHNAMIIGSRNTVRNNQVVSSGPKPDFARGIWVNGSFNVLEGNTVTGWFSESSDSGAIVFAAGTTGNVYRGNMLRDNCAGVADGGTGNTDGGGNAY